MFFTTILNINKQDQGSGKRPGDWLVQLKNPKQLDILIFLDSQTLI